MLTSVLHRIAAIPIMYDTIQRVAGHKAVYGRIQEYTNQIPHHSLVLDAGGGTGASSKLWPAESTYICLDLDQVKLTGLERNSDKATGILGDATLLPFKDESFDVVTCIAVSHHIPDERLSFLFEETMRVLKPTGSLLFMDAVWDDRRRIGKLIWKYDRGSHPRQPDQLRARIAAHGKIALWEEFYVYHHYVFCVAQPG